MDCGGSAKTTAFARGFVGEQASTVGTANGHRGNPAMPLDPTLQSAMLAAVPAMRDFAMSLCHRPDRVEDLVQEALLRAMTNIELFTPDTNMTAWLFTILRHHFLNECRRNRREVLDVGGYFVGTMTSQPEQEAHLQLGEFEDALAQLPDDQREAVILVGCAGLSYDEAAKRCHCALGTIKSRVFRARTRLAEIMSIDGPQELGADRAIQAALTTGNLRWAA
jgi:RNA polymerase sigma-70 factor (ECF subfamily)